MSVQIIVGKGSCGIAAGANTIAKQFEAGLQGKGEVAHVVTTGCIGMCYLEPIVDLYDPDSGQPKRTYVRVDEMAVTEILKELAGEENHASDYFIDPADQGYLAKQYRIALAHCGLIDPTSIDSYVEHEGYQAIERAVTHSSPEQVIEQMKQSGLSGRGGAGFPTWFKWQATRNSPGEKKYVICNADEGDPGAFMDRAILEGDPHAVIEGMLVAAYAIGADEGVVYVRAEYPLAIERLELAISQAEAAGYLGDALFGSSFCFRLRIKAGAGAFVCGEETALIASLEGERGMPRLKPPFPAQKGYWQLPSNINNVETYANVPWILRHGGAAFASLGTEHSKGTKVFALTGKIQNGGLVEIPMGSTINEVVFGAGGGIKQGGTFKAVQMGGPAGGCIPASLGDTPIDYRKLQQLGAIMGSGGMVVMDETTCMVDMARYFLDFTCKESCGKCVHCRIGTKRMLEILQRIVAGEGKDGDIELLEDLADQVSAGSLCGLGQAAPNPVRTAIKYFRHEFEQHIYDHKCTAKQCKPLLRYQIQTDKCTGCTVCARNCPVDAISGAVKQPHLINQQGCIKCGKCHRVCRFSAIEVG